MKELYTYIMEFRGGTYITQVQASDLDESLMEWTNNLRNEKKEILYLGDKTIVEIIEQVISKNTETFPSILKGLKNVWCLTLSTSQGFGIINIVKTKE